ncbi:MAG: tail fiber domain-containing protein [Ignavibacteriales bacterium]|nr:tail fiber domain-containing protein [Ignavibacteriales bacterium]
MPEIPFTTQVYQDIRGQGDNAGVNTFNSQGGALGSEYQFLVDLLKGNIDKGNPLINQIFSTGKNAILSSGETARKSASESLASSGLYGSGAGAGVNTQIAGQEGQALKELNLGTQTNQLDYSNQMINNLLGLNQFAGGQNLSQLNLDFNRANAAGGYDQFLQNMTYQKDNTPSALGSILGSLISGGAQVGSAAIKASDKKIKKDIKYTGEKTKEGIPVATFKYKKGDDRTYKGVIADDVEKIKPSAMVKAVDYSKISLN